jgi:anti-anti-sigma factor
MTSVTVCLPTGTGLTAGRAATVVGLAAIGGRERLMQGAVSLSRPGVVTMSGEIDMAVQDELARVRALVDGVLESEGSEGSDAPVDWLVDVRDVTFMDSTGLGFLAHTHRVLTERGGSLTLVGPSPTLMRTLTIVHLDEVLKIAEDLPREADA